MNVLAIDYGQKRVGLAWVQTGVDVVLPYGNVSPEEVVDIVKKEGINVIVIGLPLSQDGQENKHMQTVRAFAARLQEATGVPVQEIDERFSSKLADSMNGDLPAGEAGATRDEKAAMVILQTYMDRQKT